VVDESGFVTVDGTGEDQHRRVWAAGETSSIRARSGDHRGGRRICKAAIAINARPRFKKDVETRGPPARPRRKPRPKRAAAMP